VDLRSAVARGGASVCWGGDRGLVCLGTGEAWGAGELELGGPGRTESMIFLGRLGSWACDGASRLALLVSVCLGRFAMGTIVARQLALDDPATAAQVVPWGHGEPTAWFLHRLCHMTRSPGEPFRDCGMVLWLAASLRNEVVRPVFLPPSSCSNGLWRTAGAVPPRAAADEDHYTAAARGIRRRDQVMARGRREPLAGFRLSTPSRGSNLLKSRHGGLAAGSGLPD
jgi:hypothetical protein